MGGKKLHSKWIDELLPDCIETYVEPFGGAYWIYFESKSKINSAIYNDVNPQLHNLFNCMATNQTLLKHELDKYTAQDRTLFDKFRDELFKSFDVCSPEPDYDKAAKFIYIQTQIFSGNTLRFNTNMTDLKGVYKSKYYHYRDKFSNQKYINKMNNITASTNLSFQECIENTDSDNTFFYVDPPYFGLEDYYTFDKCNHDEVFDYLKNIKGKFALSYYDFPALTKAFPEDQYNWTRKIVNKQNGNKGKTKSSKGVEILITNIETNDLSNFL